MARPLPVKTKTVKVRSNVNVGGLTPGQFAEVDDNKYARDLIATGLWTLLVDKAAPASAPAPAPAPAVEEAPVTDEV